MAKKVPCIVNKTIIKNQIMSEFFNLFAHSLKIKNIEPIAESYVKHQLFYNNRVGYDSSTDTWYAVTGTSIKNKYDKPTKMTLTSGDGKTKCYRDVSYKPNDLGAFLIEFSPFDDNWYEYTEQVATQLADIRIAILQNAKAIKSPLILKCDSKEIATSIEIACSEKEDGSPTIIVDDTIANNLRGIETKVTYVADKLLFLYDEIRAKYLTRIGFLTRVNNTMQRIQSAEVYAIVGEAHDSIHSYIDYWNDQIQQYGLDYEMTLQGSLDEIYTNSLMMNTSDVTNADIKEVKVTSND